MRTAGDDRVAEVAKGYAFDGPAIELGALVEDGTARPEAAVRIPLAMVNRHGLVAGATGTGKTKTLQLMAEQLSAAGVPVLAADIKGDLSGLAQAGDSNDKVTARATEVGQTWSGVACPVELLALGGEGSGLTLRATMTSFGPTLLSKVLGLNEVQESSLGLVFHFADKAGLPMLDLKDLRAVIQFLTSDEGEQELKSLGGLSRATAGVILRELIGFEDQGADRFFGEPEFDTADLLRVDASGRGIVSLLELPQLQDRPRLFSTFLMWLLADLFHDLPEVGDVDKPKLVFFFDEAHLLFDDASEGVPGRDRADRAADPVQGCRRLLRDADTQGRARRRAGAARQPGAARAARLHPGRREGAEGDRIDLPDVGLRPRGGADPGRHRRGGRHGDVRAWRADAGGVDAAAGTAVADGAGRCGRADGGRGGLAAARRSTPSRWTASRPTSGWPPSCRRRRPARPVARRGKRPGHGRGRRGAAGTRASGRRRSRRPRRCWSRRRSSRWPGRLPR